MIAVLSIGCDAPPQGVPVDTASPAQPTAAAAAGQRADGTAISSRFDVDGDGKVGSQTDAILIHRYIAGFRGEPLVKGAVGPACQRCTAEQIAAYLDSF